MRAYTVVVLTPTLDQHLRLQQRVEDLAIQKLITQLAVEGLHVAVLPRTTRLDVQRLDIQPCQPAPHSIGRELRSVI